MNKKVYGIDLGTSTSTIIDKDTLYTEKPISSNVNLTKRLQIGKYETSNTDTLARGYKINMSNTSLGDIPREASTIILEKLISLVPEGEKEVIISVPAYFSGNQRDAVYEAAKGAGIQVKRLINEPTAGAYYLYNKYAEMLKDEPLIVYDLGGGTFDVSILMKDKDGDIIVKSTLGKKDLGGDKLDTNLLLETLNKAGIRAMKQKPDLNDKLLMRIKKIKDNYHDSSKSLVIPIKDIYTTAKVDEVIFTSGEYYSITQSTFSFCNDILTSSIINELSIDELAPGKPLNIALIGGSCANPLIPKIIEREVGSDFKLNILTIKEEKELIVTLGLQQLIKDENYSLDEPCKRFSLEVSNNISGLTLVERGEILPVKASYRLTNPTKTSKMSIKIAEGDNFKFSDNDLVLDKTFDLQKVYEPNQCKVIIRINVTIDGIPTIKVIKRELMSLDEIELSEI